MKVRYDEGLAIRIGPKPCVDVRKDVDEASVGEGTGQPLSHEICNWGDTTQTVSGFQRKNRNCLTRSVSHTGCLSRRCARLFRACMSTAHLGSGLVRAMRDEFLFFTAGDLDWAGFLLGVFDRGSSFEVVGAGASIRVVSVISSPKRAATSLSSRTFSALSVALVSGRSCSTLASNSLSSTSRSTKSRRGISSSRAPTP